MSILATLPVDAQLTDSWGIITRVHQDQDGQPDGFEVVAPVGAFVAIGATEKFPASDGWRRFLVPEGLAYVHSEVAQVEKLALLLALERRGYDSSL